MKIVQLNFKTGALAVEDAPPPTLKSTGVLVANAASLVSAGTEKAVIELARMNPLQKARNRPDLVRKVLAKAGQEGLIGTAKIVQNLVSMPLPLGYSCAGIVRQVGSQVTDLHPGQRVACAGLGYANHAEMVFVPRNLVTPIPDGLGFSDAAYVTVGAIAMHGVRQAEVAMGEAVVVLGLGLVGQIVAQLCSAAGCRVFCTDLDPSKVELALSLGAEAGSTKGGEELVQDVKSFTRNRGADAILICAGTKSSEPLTLAPELSRDRARIVALGDVGHDIPRRAYYEKELELRESRSYGPGRYDPSYEENGVDYPIGYVRWTENRNMESFLDLLAAKKVQVDGLTTHSFPIESAEDAYGLLSGERKEPYIGILLEYDAERDHSSVVAMQPEAADKTSHDEVVVSVVGAGQFAQGILLPALRKVPGVTFRSFATGSGLTAMHVGRKYNAETSTSDYATIMSDAETNAVLIATRHDTHASIVIKALEAGKYCFVEKPLAMNPEELTRVVRAESESPATVQTGFNRRFSPLAARLAQSMRGRKLNMLYRINAGPIPPEHWHQEAKAGGGRIVGEVCHFIDVMVATCGALPVEVCATAVDKNERQPADSDDLSILIRFADGSIGTVIYTSGGSMKFPKERLEVFGEGKVGVIDNWRTLKIVGQGEKHSHRSWVQSEKGFDQEMEAFVASIKNGSSAIPIEQQVATTAATFAIRDALRSGQWEPVLDMDYFLLPHDPQL